MKIVLTLLVAAAAHGAPHAHESTLDDVPACSPSPLSYDGEDESEEFRRALDLLQAQEFDEAERAFRRVLEADPENGPAWFFLGYSLHMLERLEDALEVHVKAAEFKKHRPSALYNAGCACALLGRKDEAFAWIEKAFAAGFYNRNLVSRDDDLDSLRDDPRLEQYLPIDEPCAPFLGDVRVLQVFVGEAAGDQFGWVGRNAGDCDGDGKNDVLISAPYQSSAGTNAGRIYVYSGDTGELLFHRSGAPGETLGMGVEAAGDVDADGRPDIIAGAPNGHRAGRAYVYSGATGETLLELSAGERGDGFGWKVAGVGDMNDDGHDDVAVGAPWSDLAGRDAGLVYVYSGRNGSVLFTVAGQRDEDEAGTAVAGHVDSERKLLAVGACNAGPGRRGRVTVYSIREEDEGTGVALPQRLFTIDADDTGHNLGRMFVSFAGDVDGDGVVDVYASDWENKARGRATGRVYVHSGRTGKQLMVLTGEHAGDRFGVGVARAGDVDADGCDDLVIGAWRSSEGAPSGGKCYVYSGASEELIHEFVSTTTGETFGFDAAGMGDLDGDGGTDYLITAAWSHAKGKRTGRAYVIAGPCLETIVATPTDSSGGD